jgi:hypothetical protein
VTGHFVRRLAVAIGLAGALGGRPSRSAAQTVDSLARRDSTTALPSDTTPPTALPPEIAAEAAARFNADSTLRVVGRLDVAAGRELRSDVAALDGPVTIAGHIAGRVTIINSDVTLAPGTRIDGDLLVVGGAAIVPAPDSVVVRGPTLIFAQRLRYHADSGRLVVESEADAATRWWQRWLALRHAAGFRDVTITSAHTYNRVEGLPIYLGPTVHRDVPWGAVGVDALGIVRTSRLTWSRDVFGYKLATGATVGHGRDGSVTFTARAYDDVVPIEDWQLGDDEVGLASFFFRRDYRDYYERHGGNGSAAFADGYVDLTLSFSNEHWGSRQANDPLYVFRSAGRWRPNPSVDDGVFQTLRGGLRFDTRNDRKDPWAGWYLTADVEYGTGRISQYGARSPGPEPVIGTPTTPVGPLQPTPVNGPAAGTAYTRGFFDLRRYNRLGPTTQFNVRAVLGGWLGGDEMPLERRLSVGGPGTIPGFDFRTAGDDHPDVASCAAGPAPPGRPAQCDRVALLQAEFRDDLRVDIGRAGHGLGLHRDGAWVLFADAGRGWLVGPRDGLLRYPSAAFPAPSSFLTDAGVGFVIDPVGVYLAKGLSYIQERPHVEIRVQRRF